MKLPLSLNYIRTAFLRALDNVNEKLRVSLQRSQRLQHAKSPSRGRVVPKKSGGGKTSKAKGSPRSEATKFNHFRKDPHGTHG